FTLEAVDGAPMPAAGGGTVTNPDATGGTATFGDITYTKPGTYIYTVTESGSVAGVTNDAQATKTVTVVVTDNGDGTLTATYNEGKPATFTNTYGITKEGEARVSLIAAKRVQATAGSTVPDWSYTLTLKDEDGRELSSRIVSSDAGDKSAPQTVTFDAITYDEPGTYSYTVTESGEVAGITNDPEATTGKALMVVVTDNGDGTLSASSSSTVDDPLTFTNTYDATSHGVAKIWAGDSELSELRPSSVTVHLLADGKDTGRTLELSSANGWTGTFRDLPKNSDSAGTAIHYTMEEDVPSGYVASYQELNGGLDSAVTNTLETGELTVSKTVSQDEGLTAPDKVFNFKVQLENTNVNGMLSGLLFENGAAQLDLKGGQSYTLRGLPVGGYTVTETPVAGFETTSEGAEGTISSDAASTAAFTNTYKATPATLELAASKTLDAADGLRAPDVTGRYIFALSGADGAPMPDKTSVTNVDGKGGASAFGTVTYTTPGTYVYTVTESGEVAGVTNDAQAASGKTVKVQVTDNGVGQLVATVVEGSATTNFTNTYSATGELDTSTTTILKKTVVAGGTAWADKTFSFQLVPLTGSPEPENDSASVTFSQAGTQTVPFGKIVFDKPGTFGYQVFETTKSGDGWTCDGNVHDVTVTVTDNGDGTLKAEVTTPAEITNSYDTTPITDGSLQVTKTLTGSDLSAGMFTFELRNADGTLVAEASNDADGKVTFSGLTYAAAGTYTYTISERDDKEPGYTYDAAASTVTVKVVDNGDGTLGATPEYSKTTFNNAYAASGDITISARKTLGGKQIQDGQFTFELLDSEGKVIQTTTNEGESVKFNLHYDESLFAGAATSDAADGTGSTSTASNATAAGATTPGTDAGAAGSGSDASDSTDATSGNGSSADSPKASASDAGSVSEGDASVGASLAKGIEDLLVTEANAAEPDDALSGVRTKAFSYTIREVNDGKAGYTYATNEVPVRVTVTDEGNGKITAVATYPGDTSFHNTYAAKGSTTITAKKVLEGKDLADGQFSFTLADGAGNSVATATNKADGTVSFDVTFDESQLGENTFALTENGNDARGYTYDTKPRWVKVNVSDNGDGTLAVSSPVFYLDSQAGPAPDASTFKNTYKPLETSVQLRLQKRVVGPSGTLGSLDGRRFEFELSDDATGLTKKAYNDASGNVVFGTWTYSEAGTHTYTVREVAGTDPSITYDTNTYKVTVEVSDVDGQLQATVSPESLVVTNHYQPKSVTTGELTAEKRVTGYEGDEYPTFSFTLKAEDDAYPMPEGSAGGTKTVSLSGPGKVEFGGITFDKAGDYSYLVFEVQGKQSGWTYDQARYRISYHVTDDGSGQLAVETSVQPVTADGVGDAVDKAVFANSYQEPGSPSTPETPSTPNTPKTPSGTKPAPKAQASTPGTGDYALGAGGIALLGGAAVAVAAVLRRRDASK
ncbi:MAG: FctA domain-containing protein, partial [Olsenella sp.]